MIVTIVYGFVIRNMRKALLILDCLLGMMDISVKPAFVMIRKLNSDLNFYIAGGGATRRLEHTLDLSNRLLYRSQYLLNILSFN